MADTVRRVEYAYAMIPDAPGEGDRILAALSESGVNLLACVGFPTGGGRSQLDLVSEDAAALRATAEQAGITLSETKQALLVQGDDRIGAVQETTAKLAQAGVNITAIAAIGAGSGQYGVILWVAPDDLDRAAHALGA
jgi:hypothetical protein